MRLHDQELSQVRLESDSFNMIHPKKALKSPSELLYRLCTAILMIVAKLHLQIFDVKKLFN